MEIKQVHTIFLITFLILISCADTSSSNGTDESSGGYDLDYQWAEDLTLSWHDEFDGSTLDTTKWEAPDNVPRQGASRWMSDQVSLTNGKLRLGISLSDDDTANDNVNYNCGAVRTQKSYTTDLFTQTYGYFETRCKLPANIDADYWAAFWMMSGDVADDQSDTQLGHEIDIMESFTIVDGGQHKLTLHWNG